MNPMHAHPLHTGVQPRKGPWWHGWCCSAMLAIGLTHGISARGEALPEYQLKAAFVYNFASFTEWPSTVGSALNLCIYGHDPFGPEIDGLNGKSIGARTLLVTRKHQPEALKTCHIVFIAAPDIHQLPVLLSGIQGLPILVLADSPGAAQQGVTLNMKMAQGRVTFEANLGAARTSGLTLSSRMLRLATEVIP